MSVLIEVVNSPGCAKCMAARDVIKKFIKGREGVELRELDVLEHPERIVELGVMMTPAIAINGKLVFSKIPRPEELERAIGEAGGA